MLPTAEILWPTTTLRAASRRPGYAPDPFGPPRRAVDLRPAAGDRAGRASGSCSGSQLGLGVRRAAVLLGGCRSRRSHPGRAGRCGCCCCVTRLFARGWAGKLLVAAVLVGIP